MFKLVHKNKKGVTLVELMVTLVVLGLVIPLAGQILYSLTNFFNMATYRWEIQSAVKLACTKFETERDTIINAYEADVLYDPIVAGGITVKSTNPLDFEWRGIEIPTDEEFDPQKTYSKSTRENPYVVATEGVKNSEDLYTYIFSTPAFDEGGNYLGTYLFVREFNTENSTLFLDKEGFGTVPVNIKFSLKVAPGGIDPVTGAENPALANDNGDYLKQTVHFDFESGLTNVTNYKVETEFALINAEREINAPSTNTQQQIMLDSWLHPSDDKKNAGPAGWVKGYPTEGDTTTSFTYGSDTIHTVKNYGNVMRFISPAAFKDQSGTGGEDKTMDLASCLTDWTFSNVVNADVYLDNIKLFRDNVLRGTEFGDWFIHQYYYVWSPFLIEHTAFLKPVYQAILIPVSYVCEFIAKL